MTTTQGSIKYDASVAVALGSKAKTALSNAQGFVIDSHDMLEIAAEDLRNIKALQKEVEEQRTAITGPMNQALKAVNDLFRAPKEFLENAETTLKRSIVGYNTEQERLRLAAQREAEEAARKERERLAEIEREQLRAAAQAEEAARKAQHEAEQAKLAGDDEALRVAEQKAQEAIEQAQSATQEAHTAAQVAEIVTMPISVPPAAKVSGISGRKTYSAQVDDLMALIKAVAEGKAPVEAVIPDMKFLGAQARAYKRAGQLYPGVTAIEDRSIAARAS